MNEQEYYWKPIKKNQFKGEFWNPREKHLARATDKEMHNTGFIKYFKKVGPVVPEYALEPVEPEEKPERMSIAERSPEQRLDLIRKKTKEFNKSDRKQWFRNIPKLDIMNGKLPFVTNYDEIRQALGVE